MTINYTPHYHSWINHQLIQFLSFNVFMISSAFPITPSSHAKPHSLNKFIFIIKLWYVENKSVDFHNFHKAQNYDRSTQPPILHMFVHEVRSLLRELRYQFAILIKIITKFFRNYCNSRNFFKIFFLFSKIIKKTLSWLFLPNESF